MEDKRFAHIAKDPKFRRIPKAQSKVKIDRRFQSMFTDKKFQVKYSTDKRGRPVKHHSKEDLKRYYEVSSDEEAESSESESEDEVEITKPGKFVRAPKIVDSTEEDTKESESEKETDKSKNKLDAKDRSDKKLAENIKERLKDLNIDYARGERSLYSDSSSDDEETDDEISESEEIDHRWGELDADAGQTNEVTHRLAACNLDWDRIRAMDLMVLFNSFLPPGGVIKSVIIYPSEFGKQRLKEEEIKGPIELVESKKDVKSADETEEGSQYHMEKLRQYQLNRLKYYYAVITFDNPNSANKIYTECDGMEYESSATKIDLRFIPDDMTFDDSPKESCDKLPDKYEPRFFTTTALQQAKVQLTWDETNPDRLEFADKVNSGKVDDISERDLQNYLAGSSNEEDCDDKSDGSDLENSQSGNMIDKYKALLLDIQEKEEEQKNKDVGMEISWGIDLKEKTDQLVKEKLKNNEEKTPFQKYLDKRKEKRKERKELKKKSQEDSSEDSDMPSDIDMNDPYFAEEFANSEFKKKTSKTKNKKGDRAEETEEGKQQQAELDLLLMNGEETEQKKHFSLKKIQEKESESKSKKKKKNKKKQSDGKDKNDEDDFKVNVEDKRFSAIFTSHHYNIDPTHPHYKKTKGMDTLIQEKLKRRNEDAMEIGESKKFKKEESKGKKKDVELNMLVKNVKRNAQAFRK